MGTFIMTLTSIRFQIFLFFGFYCRHAIAGGCEVLPPKDLGDPAKQVGLIFIPGAKLAGSSYIPLLEKVQEHYPGPLWVGATENWLNDMPNPIEIGGQISACMEAAEEQGLSTEFIFFGGHSLGGIVLESYISGHAEIARGIALIGTWLPDLLGEKHRGSNEYPVPVLTAIGELDGGGLSYLRREVEETEALPGSVTAFTKTILVPQVNHAQVASGETNEEVVDNDIDPELTEEEAHEMYAQRMGDWLSLNALHLELISQEDANTALSNFAEYETATAEFLEPFFIAYNMEQVGLHSDFVIEAQEWILDLDNAENVLINSTVLTNMPTFQGYSPSVKEENGIVSIKTYLHFNYDTDLLDFNNHLSASTVKAKMKLADFIYPLIGLPERNQMLSCAEMNKKSMEIAMSIASEAALERMDAKGRRLEFGEDDVYVWGGVPWEYSGGLKWTINPDNSVELKSARLTSDPNFPFFPGEHYCDLLSPYRALEWIYIESIRHTMQFS